MDTLKKDAPLIYDNLAEAAEQEGQYIEECFNSWSAQGYYYELIKYCQEEIKIAEQRPLMLEIARTVRNKRAILQGPLRDVLAKYQVMLDNELYKVIKAFRETQVWRLNSLNGFVLEKGSVSGK